MQATPKNVLFMVLISFFGAAFAAFCGVGPGFIFSPVLILLGI
jgi:uncharacterized membrane protein YfcA